MAQVKLLKIDPVYGIPLEFDTATDEITLNGFTVQGGGPVLSGTGLDLNAQDISDIKNVTFNNSATATIAVNSTTFLADNMMFETKENNITTAGAVLFPVITDTANTVDAFRLPAIAGAPTATPADGGEGYLVWDSTGNRLFAWNGTVWDDLSTVTSAQTILEDSYTAEEAVGVCKAVYISSADSVSLAKADVVAKTAVIGFTKDAALITAPVSVVKAGSLAGFTGLTAGSRYYLGTTAGEISTSLPTGAGNVIVQAGFAKNTTTLDLQIAQLGRRAV